MGMLNWIAQDEAHVIGVFAFVMLASAELVEIIRAFRAPGSE